MAFTIQRLTYYLNYIHLTVFPHFCCNYILYYKCSEIQNNEILMLQHFSKKGISYLFCTFFVRIFFFLNPKTLFIYSFKLDFECGLRRLDHVSQRGRMRRWMFFPQTIFWHSVKNAQHKLCSYNSFIF